ncbi:hypothetical protein MUK42_03082 [Musa troglodytarum]|uniref:Uncharacterized protein n=1 Tax=Musa troglodytarum TaxID=320322 RepID=A0A9E7KMH8_9LILI|nr:hypothetical protein MUK42_03082 [Musa troglodytarum]
MGRDSKPKESGDKGKGKQAASSATDDNASNGKGKGGKSSDGLDTCTFVKAHSRKLAALKSQGTYYVKNKARLMKHRRSSKMAG